MIPRALATRPHRRQLRELSRQRGRIKPQHRINGIGKPRHAALMRQRFGDSRGAFAVGCKLRPIVGNRRVVVEQSTLDQRGDNQRANRLGRRIDRAKRALIPRDGPRAIREPTAQVHHQFITQIDREARPMLQPLGKVPRERLAHRIETSRDKSGDAHARDIVPQARQVNLRRFRKSCGLPPAAAWRARRCTRQDSTPSRATPQSLRSRDASPPRPPPASPQRRAPKPARR